MLLFVICDNDFSWLFAMFGKMLNFFVTSLKCLILLILLFGYLLWFFLKLWFLPFCCSIFDVVFYCNVLTLFLYCAVFNKFIFSTLFWDFCSIHLFLVWHWWLFGIVICYNAVICLFFCSMYILWFYLFRCFHAEPRVARARAPAAPLHRSHADGERLRFVPYRWRLTSCFKINYFVSELH